MLTHKGTQTIETARLVLRQARQEDAAAMYRNWTSDPEVTKYLTWPTYTHPDTANDILRLWVESYAEKNFYQWMIVPRDVGQPIGSISVVAMDERAEWAEIGYCIGRAWWRQGITSEAMNAVMEFLFLEVGMNRIEAKHDTNNPHSGAVMRKCGMRFEGISRASFRNNQGICDNARYALLRQEWERKKLHSGLSELTDDTAVVQELYSRYSEDTRLNHSKAAMVEYYTTVRTVENYLKPGDRILDIGAGTGAYSIYFAEKGYQVSALELADANIAVFREKLKEGIHVDLAQGNALDLSRYCDESFDLVLLMGPLYHLHKRDDRIACIREAKRVCKRGGRIIFSFISNDIVLLTMQKIQPDFFVNGAYDKETFQLDNVPFVFHTLQACRELLKDAGIRIVREIAADGVSELICDTVNALDKTGYEQYLKYHTYLCEKPECLGFSNHLLFVGEIE